MKTEERTGRNEPCPCGSGKKFKACCADRVDAAGVAVQPGGTPWTAIVLVVIALAIVAAIALRSAPPGATDAGVLPLPAGGQPGAQPGPAPAGKVWSAEHGHWHDDPQGAAQGTPGAGAPGAAPSAAPGAPIAQPGPAPEGQVWSAEHGHFHDAATGQVPTPAPQPAPVPTENTPPPQ